MKNDWKKRLLTEQAELQRRLDGLRDFIGGPVWHTLPEHDCDLLRMQQTAMQSYMMALTLRIQRMDSNP